MSQLLKLFKFDRKNNTISFKGDVIVDMSLVPSSAKAKFYSGVNEDHIGFDTNFCVTESSSPFDLNVTSLSPTGLVKAIIENSLKVEGMVVSQNINDAYSFLGSNSSLH